MGFLRVEAHQGKIRIMRKHRFFHSLGIWLIPGLHIKRWLLFLLLGITLLSLGLAYLLRAVYIAGPYPAFVYWMTLQFLPRAMRAMILGGAGIALSVWAFVRLHQSTLTADDINLFSEFDLCILSVKGFDLSDTLRALRGKTTAKTVFLPLLNGIDIDSQIHKVFPNHVVLPACVYISSHIEKPGVVVQTGGPCSIIFGRDPVHPMHSPNEIPELFKNAGINHQWLDDPTPKIWEKFIFIAPFSLVTACFDKTIGEVIGTPTLSRYVRAIMEEIVQLADKMGIRFPGNIITATFEKAKNFPENTRTSFQNDFAKPQKRDEREIFGGTILRLCKKERIRCDITAELYQKLNAIKPYCA